MSTVVENPKLGKLGREKTVLIDGKPVTYEYREIPKDMQFSLKVQEIDCGGVIVKAVEYVFENWEEGKGKVALCRPPLEEMVVEGNLNFICNHDFPSGDDVLREASKRRCREAFILRYSSLLKDKK